jgi:hypothetical protein
MGPNKIRVGRSGDVLSPPVVPEPVRDDVPAWERVGAGRYMPRRIKGSFPGRELG